MAPVPTVLAHLPPPRSCRPFLYSHLLLFTACRDGGQPDFDQPGGWEDGRSHHRWQSYFVRPAGKATQWDISGGDLQNKIIGPQNLWANCYRRDRLIASRLETHTTRIYSNTTSRISVSEALIE
jgi:hypothetical protein